VTEIVCVGEEAPEGGFVAEAVGAWIHTEADMLEMLRTAIPEAVACHFEEGHGLRVIRLATTTAAPPSGMRRPASRGR
jgi:hypothetical protein